MRVISTGRAESETRRVQDRTQRLVPRRLGTDWDLVEAGAVARSIPDESEASRPRTSLVPASGCALGLDQTQLIGTIY